MIEYVFGRIIILSIIGALLSLALLLIRPITKRIFSSRWHYYTYVLAMLIFLIPLSISLPKPAVANSVGAAHPQGGKVHTKENYVGVIVITNPDSDISDDAVTNSAQKDKEDFDFKSAFQQISKYAFYIWLFGTVLYLSFSVISHFVFIKNAMSLSTEDGKKIHVTPSGRSIDIIRTSFVSSPVLVGITKTRLFMPDTELSDEAFNSIMLHESVHARRCDIAIKWICLVAKSVHWFNPLVHILSHLVETECEISCDKEATRHLDNDGIKNYCETILSLITAKDEKSSTALCAGGTKKTLERRFKAIMEKKKVSKRIAVISVIIAAIITLGAVTASALLGGKAKDEKKKADTFSAAVSDKKESDKAQTNNENAEVPKAYDSTSDNTPDESGNENTILYRVVDSNDEIATLRVAKVGNSAEISAGFDSEKHPAVDYRLEAGTPVASPFDGEVLTAEYAYDKGNYVEILCVDGTTIVLFAHLEKMNVAAGDKVNAGDIIGTVGTTGMSTGSHLHVEYCENGQTVNPVGILIIEENGDITAVVSQPEMIID